MRLRAILLSFLAFLAQPAFAASSPSLTSLEQQLASMVSSSSTDVGIAALDLNTGETVSIKGNTPFPMASTVKVAVAALYLAQVDHGQQPFAALAAAAPAAAAVGAAAGAAAAVPAQLSSSCLWPTT